MKNIIFVSFLFAFSSVTLGATSSFILPSDYESQKTFIRVTSAFDLELSERVYTFENCQGDIKKPVCAPISQEFSSKVSSSRLRFIKYAEATKGTILGTAEVLVGGVLFRALTKFILPLTYKIVKKSTDWDEGVAIGSVALIPAALTSTGATYFSLRQFNERVEVVDPLERFSSSRLVGQVSKQTLEIILVDDSFKKLKKRILNLIKPPKQL